MKNGLMLLVVVALGGCDVIATGIHYGSGAAIGSAAGIVAVDQGTKKRRNPDLDVYCKNDERVFTSFPDCPKGSWIITFQEYREAGGV